MTFEDTSPEPAAFSTYAEARWAMERKGAGNGQAVAGSISVERGHYFVTLADGTHYWYL